MPSTVGRMRVVLAALSLAAALGGCSGGVVSVRSNLSGAAPAPAVPLAPVKAAPGLTAHYSGSGNLGFAVLGVLIVADLVNWTATQLKYAFAAEAAPPPGANAQPHIRMPAKCVYPVPEMC